MFNPWTKMGEGELKIAEEEEGYHKKHMGGVSATAFSTARVFPSLASYLLLY